MDCDRISGLAVGQSHYRLTALPPFPSTFIERVAQCHRYSIRSHTSVSTAFILFEEMASD